MATPARAAQLMQMLVDRGFTPQGAAAAVGSAWLESGLRNVIPSWDGSNGLWQWRDAANVHRLSDLQSWSMSQGLDWRTDEAQVGFLQHEMQTQFPGLYSEMTTPGSGSIASLSNDFTRIYEKPADYGLAYDTRAKYANQAYDAWQNQSGADATQTGTDASTQSGSDATTQSGDAGLNPIVGQGENASAMFGLSGPSSLLKLQPAPPIGPTSNTPTLASGATDSGYGAPIVVTDVTSAGAKGFAQASQSVQTAGQAVKQGAEDVGQKIQTSEQQFAQTATQQTTRVINQSTNLGDWFAELTAGASGLVARVGVGLAAIVLVGLALWLAGRQQLA